MLNITNRVISQLNTSNALMNRFVRLKGQLDTKCASYLRYLATKNAINRAVDYHYLGLAVQESTAPVNGIDYIHPVVKPAVDYVSAVIVKGLAPDGEINMEFMPENEQDADAARQASDMVDFVLNRENDPHFILQRWVMDACMHKNGMLMVLPKREQIVRYVESSGTLDQLRAFETQAEESGLTVLRQSRRKTGVDMAAVMKEVQARAPGLAESAAQSHIDNTLSSLRTAVEDDAEVEQPDAPEIGVDQEDLFAEVIAKNTQYTAKYKLTGWNLQIKFRNIAQHYWICDPTVQEMKDQAFCGYYDPMSIQEAVYLYPELNDHLEEFREFAEYNQNGAYQAGSVLNNLAIHARDSVPVQGIPVMSGVGSDPDSRQVTILTVWDRYDIDGDGELELIEIVYSGTYIISAREVEYIPVANMCPKPLPGNFYGMSVGESVIPMQEYMTAGSRAEILLGLLTATPRLGVKPDRVDFEMMQDGEAAIFILDSKFNPATDVYPMPPPGGNLGFIENAMVRMQQDTQAMIGMTQPGDVFNPEVMAAGNSGEKLAMALGPNQIIQDNAVRNAADGLKEAIYLIWRTLIQYGDDYGVRRMAQKFSPTQEPVFLDYKAWDEMNVFERKQIHIELALGMMSDDNRVKRQQLIQQTQMGFVGQIQALQQQGIFDMALIEKIKRPFADTLYAVGVKNCDTYLPTDQEIQAMIQKAQQSAQQAQEQAKTNPPAEEVYRKSQAALNDAKIQEIQAKIGGDSATHQLDYMALAQGTPKVYHD